VRDRSALAFDSFTRGTAEGFEMEVDADAMEVGADAMEVGADAMEVGADVKGFTAGSWS
jgi:hypothetical protein